MAMSCLLWLIVLWHLSKATKLFLIACVHYNYKWVANSILDFQISSSEVMNQNIHTQLCMNVKTRHHHMNYLTLDFQFFSFIFVPCKCYLQKVAPQKFWSLFSFFGCYLQKVAQQKSWNIFFLFLEPQPWISPKMCLKFVFLGQKV